MDWRRDAGHHSWHHAHDEPAGPNGFQQGCARLSSPARLVLRSRRQGQENTLRRTLVVGSAASLIGLAALDGNGQARAQTPDSAGVRAATSAFYAALNAYDIRAMETLWA